MHKYRSGHVSVPTSLTLFHTLGPISLLRHICLLLRLWCNLGLRKLLLHRQPANREVMLSVCEPGDTEVNSHHQG